MKWAALESKMLSAYAYDDSQQVPYLRTPQHRPCFIATSSPRLPITRPSQVQNRRADFSALTSAIITSATSCMAKLHRAA